MSSPTSSQSGQGHSHDHGHGVLEELRPQHRALRQAIPEVYRSFNDLGAAALAEGALPTKVKELMAMAIGVAHGGYGCIA